MPEQNMIPCPWCLGSKEQQDNDAMGSAYAFPCPPCKGSGTIPDRRAPSAAEAALRAEVEALRQVVESQNQLPREKQAELAHPEPMVPLRLVEDLAAKTEAFMRWVDETDGHGEALAAEVFAAIRAAREGESK